MNKLLLLIFLFFFSTAYGQRVRGGDFNLSQLPAYVTDQWKFHAGDNPVWADTTFDDENWQHINPTKLQHFLPQVSKAQVCWFRLKIYVDPALRSKAVALVINQPGAAEVYFNGTLIRSMGKIGSNGQTLQSYSSDSEPLILQLTKAPKQYLTVRYSFDRSLPVAGYGGPVIDASFHQSDSAWRQFFITMENYISRAWLAGCFMLLGMLQLAIYFLKRDRKINLYLAIYAFLQAATFMNALLDLIFPGDTLGFSQTIIFTVAAPLAWLLLLAMTIEIFGFKRDWRFRVSAWLCLVTIAILFFTYNSPFEHFALYIQNISIYLFIISICVKAVRRRQPGAWLFLTGIVMSLIFYVLFADIIPALAQPLLLREVEFVSAFLIPAVLLALMLAREFVQNNLYLQQKLIEVHTLSARSLEQEAEKQLILSRQNEVLEQKVAERTAELNQSLSNLKSAQTQLIQSEKMASLGELTAGIAHEIQNPLNFVNNFSDVSAELVEEMQEELNKGDKEEAIAISEDIKQNLEKIRHHGKRADAIVKGMLEHSRSASGHKELTDINQLADEYLRLSYHGLRAKDKTFNAELITHFDAALPKVNAIPQDIGRVLLNMFNNAFYAVNQKQKTAGADYKPEVTVTTSTENGQVIIKVKDNGIGIPDAIKEKIMQPFFTTKPTGEGTGLGLSLSYDMVVKGHGGKIDLLSKEHQYTEFIITLPL